MDEIVEINFEIEVDRGGPYGELLEITASGNEDEILELYIVDETGHEIDVSELHFSVLKEIEFRAFNMIQDRLGIVVDVPILTRGVSS